MTIDPNKIPLYIELAGVLINVGHKTFDEIAALFHFSDDEVAFWRAQLAQDEPSLTALIAHLRERVPE